MPAFTRRSPVATHLCAVCPRAISNGLLMCASHWRLVPHEQQQAVNRTWRYFNGAPGPRAALAARRDYLAARDAAIDSVAALVNPATPATTTGATAP